MTGRGITIGAAVRAGLLAGLAAITGCATRPMPAGIAIAPPVAPVAAVRPVPPAGAAATQAIPPRLADGSYRTINSGLGPAGTIWHVRSALNVAALGCRGEQEAAIIASYNALLASKQSLLKAAFAQTEAEARKAGGVNWRDEHDRDMTRIYNFFAQPPAKQRFCEVAAVVAAEAAAIQPMAFTAFAGPALARLEAPFTDFYRDYDAYRVELAAWTARQPGGPPAPGLPAPVRTAMLPVVPAASVRVPIAPAAIVAPVAPPGVGAITLPYAPIDDVIAWTPPATPRDRRLAAAGDGGEHP